MSPTLRLNALLAPLVLAVVGCTPIAPHKPLLKPANLPPQSVTVEIFFIRCPIDDARAKAVWNDVDEQPFPADSRRQWLQNGMRVGLVAGQVPDALARLLELKDAPAPAQPTPEAPEAGRVDVEQEPHVVLRRLSTRPGHRTEIVASDLYDEWPVLTCESGQVDGQTYPQAQGLFGMTVANQRDGRVRVDLMPELSYGQARQRWVGDQGVYRLEAGRPKRLFEPLAVSATLRPGQILLLSTLSNRPGSLGHYFFTVKGSGKLEQKLLLVRIAQTQHDDVVPPADVLPLDEISRQ